MAEPDPKPLSSEDSDSPNKRKQTDATGDPPTKREKTTTSGDSPPSKHSDECSSTNDVQIEDAAISKNPKNCGIELDDIEIMEAILEYQKREGVFLAKSIDNRVDFYQPYLERGVGDGLKWIMRLQAMKTKFNSESAPIEDVEKKEFELWKKIWGDHPDDDDNPGVGSSN
ncbi:hypothetical protein LXL04_016390 [Taraxacum kok-saghyz]